MTLELEIDVFSNCLHKDPFKFHNELLVSLQESVLLDLALNVSLNGSESIDVEDVI